MDTYFNFYRFFLVLKRDIIENGKTALFGMLTIFSFSSLIIISSSSYGSPSALAEASMGMYGVTFLFSGYFLSGMAFKDFRNKERTMSFLTLPASSTEKFLSMLVLTTIGFYISFAILHMAFNLFNIAVIGSLPNPLQLDFINPFIMDKNMQTYISFFIPIQAIFLAGSTAFKKVPFFYTSLIIFFVGILYAILLFTTIYYIFNDYSFVAGGGYSSISIDSAHVHYQFEAEDIPAFYSLKLFLSYLIAPIFWVVAWFKIKEKEV